MKYILIRTLKNESSCEYHKGQSLTDLCNDPNFIKTHVSENVVTFACRVCMYERTYKKLELKNAEMYPGKEKHENGYIDYMNKK